MAHLEIRDAIHTRIVLSAREREVLDHPYVQRLRHIRQLGFVPLVYPSATHDRLSHSLGTMHTARRLAEKIFEDDSSSVLARLLTQEEKDFLRRILALAGLLHDVGHAPFSHSAELAMPPVSDLRIPAAWLRAPREKRIATHEDYSVLLIAEMAKGENAVLAPEEAEIIASLIHANTVNYPQSWNARFSGSINARSVHAIARSLISSNIDADRMDYLLRDSHFTGVPYGHFDFDWLVSNLGTIQKNGEYVLAIPESSIQALEHYLFARYHMYTQVYMHKTAKCFEYYFRQALKTKELSYAIPPEPELFAEMRDATLTEELFRAARSSPGSWSELLVKRIPAKRITRVWDNRPSAEKIFKSVSRELAARNVHPFFHPSYKKFLEDSRPRAEASRSGQGMFLFGLDALPIAVVRSQFGVRSAAALSDSSFILKQYQKDIYLADIYIPRQEYDSKKKIIRQAIKKYRAFSPSEIVLEDEE